MLFTWRVLVPLPRGVRVIPSGPSLRAGWLPWPGALQTPMVQGVVAVAFGLQELPQFEFPPLPRPLRDARWRQGQPAAAR